MTPPTPEQEDSALAALTGTITERTPDTALARNMLRLKLVATARDSGVPWAAIGAALGLSGQEAKAAMKRLARTTQRDMLAEQSRQDGITGKGPRHV